LSERQLGAGKAEAGASHARRVVLVASFAPSLLNFRGPLVRELLARGHEVHCLAPDFDAPVRDEVESWGAATGDYPLERTGLNPLADLASLRSLTSRLRALRPDVVMGYTPKPAIYASLAARRARVPRVVPMITGLGYAFLDDGSGRAGARRRVVRGVMGSLYGLALRASDAVVFHNQDDRDLLAARGIVPKGLAMHVVSGSGVDLAHYARQPLPAIADGLTFLMIARLVRDKGVREYCEAARIARRAAPRARFLLAGPEESGPAGFGARELGQWSDAVEYLGHAADVRPLLSRCHAYVLPSYGEGMPRTVLEAMAAGRPIITTDARGCRETVEDGVNGCLVPVADAGALAEAMLSLLRRPDLIAAMAEASRRKAESRFDVALVNRAMIDILLPPGRAAGSDRASTRA
jgi:glycosyltransferase involved in cell wall biosynthesis